MKRSILTILATALIAAAPAWAQQTGSTQQNDPALDRERTNPSSESVAEDSGLTITGQVMEVTETSLRVQSMTGAETLAITQETQGASGLEVGDQVSVDFTRSSQGVMIATEIRPADAESGSATTGTTGTGSSADTMGSTTGATGSTGSTTGTMGSTTGSTGSATGTTGSSDMTGSTGSTTGSASGSATGATGSTYGTATGTAGSTASSFDDEAESDTDMAAADQDTTSGAYTDTADTLPQTASEAPLVALLGLLALVAAVGLRTWVR